MSNVETKRDEDGKMETVDERRGEIRTMKGTTKPGVVPSHSLIINLTRTAKQSSRVER